MPDFGRSTGDLKKRKGASAGGVRILQVENRSRTSVKCKIIFDIVANHLAGFLRKNSYIDTSVQTRVIPGVPGVVIQLISEGQRSRRDLEGQSVARWCYCLRIDLIQAGQLKPEDVLWGFNTSMALVRKGNHHQLHNFCTFTPHVTFTHWWFCFCPRLLQHMDRQSK